MEYPIKITIAPGSEFHLYQENPESNIYELIFEDGEELTAHELMAINTAGYVYHSSLTDIDYEDELPGGGLRVGYMDIHYFAKVAEGTFADCLPN